MMPTRRLAIFTVASIFALAGALQLHAQSRPVTIDELREAFEGLTPDGARLVQDSLQQNGYDVGVVDGVWGAATEQAFEDLMASERYRRHAPTWTWAHEVSVSETLFFLTSDAYP